MVNVEIVFWYSVDYLSRLSLFADLKRELPSPCVGHSTVAYYVALGGRAD